MMQVCVMHQGLEGAIPFYRLYQPLKYCEKKGLLKVIFYDTKTAEKDIQSTLDTSDILVWQCPTSEGVVKWLDAVHNDNRVDKRNRKVVIEFDDNLVDISPFNEKYQVFGTKEMFIQIAPDQKDKFNQINKRVSEGKKDIWQLPDGRWEYKLWEKNQDGFFLEDNQKRIGHALEVVRRADLFQCTTKELAKTWHQYSGRTGPTAILPNLIDFERWLPQKENDTGKLRICWQGGSSHYQDWKSIEQMVLELQKEFDFTLVIAGQKWEGIHGKFKNVEFIPWHSDIRTYPLHCRNLKADIGLIPLVDNKFNRGKSCIKWLEYAALGIPAVISNVTPYKEVIDHGKTGLLVNNDTASWIEAIKQLIASKELRKELADKANKRVRLKWSVERSVEWYEAYKSLGAYSQPRRIEVVSQYAKM